MLLWAAFLMSRPCFLLGSSCLPLGSSWLGLHLLKRSSCCCCLHSCIICSLTNHLCCRYLMSKVGITIFVKAFCSRFLGSFS
ncbi:hypothetical protein HanXRQr2_Chr02g0056191 [Helianthus annuus]|uniref:Secreted protein n=1 Tax=Helianthus annuus TaxID=4232 RepID=A0A9K3JL78_HELAN|nr:hypothetical protein HanXRQr2_Chr02g0056191 [Helianthus annuus]